jgi:glycosyltransferase involved in cell wall biosynthesis
VVLNTCGERYLTQQAERPFPEAGQQVRILCFSVAHKHKNLEILPQMARLLVDQRPELDFQIVVTLPGDDWLARQVLASTVRLGVADCFENRGPVPLTQGPDLYRSCDVSILPTLLETFSANYPEAMAMGLPIVTTDLDFAHDVCDDAALYYRPGDAQAATDAIVQLLGDRQLWDRLVRRGKDVLQRFPTPQQRYQQYVRLLQSFDTRPREPASAPSISVEPAPP